MTIDGKQFSVSRGSYISKPQLYVLQCYVVEKKKLGFDRDRVHYRLLSRPSPPRCSRATGTMGETAKLSGAELEEKRKVPMPLSKPPS